MKIALVDNMNNNFFSIARYFREMGIQADLFLIPNSTPLLFLPENDSFDDVEKSDWIKFFPVSYGFFDYIFPRNFIIKKTFHNYDKVIACGQSIGFLSRAGIKVDLFIPYGADLFNFPVFQIEKVSRKITRFLPSLIMALLRSKYQKTGIKAAGATIINMNWGVAREAVEKLNIKFVNLPRLMIYEKPKLTQIAVEVFDFMSDSDFVVFSPTRHLWKTNSDPLKDFDMFGGVKRNDKLIRAFSQLVKKRLFKNPMLIFFEYGTDVKYSKSLISDLNIDDFVIWLPVMPRKLMLAGMLKADFIADQFREGMSATSAGVTNEAISCGVPIISNTEGAIHDQHDPYYGCPILQALTADEIYYYFHDYYEDKKKYIAIGKALKIWFEENLSHGLARKYVDLLNSNDCKSI
jgi:glycosyltransferase involved in cell wall biosynthesis